MGFFAILSSTMSKSPVLKPFASNLGTPTDLIGIVAAASTIPGILVSLPAASLSDILGRKRFLLISGLVFTSAPFLYLFVTVWWQLILVRFYHGFATAIFVPVAEASLATLFPEKRGERISLFSSATNVGRVIAPTLGGYVLLATSDNFHVLYLAVGVAGITALIMSLPLLVKTESSTSDPETDAKRKVFAQLFSGWKTIVKSGGVLAVSFVQASVYYAYGSAEFYLAGYLPEVAHLNPFLTGILITSIIAVAIFARPYMGRLSDRVGRRTPIIMGCLIGGLPLFFVPYVTDFWVLLLLVVIYGFGFATVLAATSALASELVPQDLLGTSMGFLDTIMDVGQTLGPIISGFILASSLQYTGVFISLGFVLLLAAFVFAVVRVTERREQP